MIHRFIICTFIALFHLPSGLKEHSSMKLEFNILFCHCMYNTAPWYCISQCQCFNRIHDFQWIPVFTHRCSETTIISMYVPIHDLSISNPFLINQSRPLSETPHSDTPLCCFQNRKNLFTEMSPCAFGCQYWKFVYKYNIVFISPVQFQRLVELMSRCVDVVLVACRGSKPC